MRIRLVILFLISISWNTSIVYGKAGVLHLQYDFYGHSVDIQADSSIVVGFDEVPSPESVKAFYERVNSGDYQPIVKELLRIKQQEKLNDWFFYQLIRKTAQQIAPKAENYPRYTLYKWFLLAKSGYDARLSVSDEKLVFFVRSDENVYDIPYYMEDDKQYVCLNIHDYVNPKLVNDKTYPVGVVIPEGKKAFSYKVTQIPDFTPNAYAEKDIAFNYNNQQYHFKIKLNPQMEKIFVNYPVVDYESYFNIPLSNETYTSLIPMLKDNVSSMNQKGGVDYLMRFTRNAFLYEEDQKVFGKEKRLSPEQTLLNEYSDCDDRAALFFYLVKEIYDLPMIVLLYPTHLTIAVKFDKPRGKTIVYKGSKYSICEPTPQMQDLAVGQISSNLRHTPFQVAYEYSPKKQ